MGQYYPPPQDLSTLLDKLTYDADFDTYVDKAEGLLETGGPTLLTAGSITDGQVFARSGNTYAGRNIFLEPSNTLFVDGVNGSDLNPLISGYKTIAASMAAAAGSPGSRIVVSPGTYSESFVLPQYTYLDARQSTIVSSASPGITLSNGCVVEAWAFMPGAGHTSVRMATAGAVATVRCRAALIAAGSIGVVNVAPTAQVYFSWDDAQIAAGGHLIGDGATSSGMFVVNGGRVVATGAGAIGIDVFGVGRVTGRVSRFIEDGGTLTAFKLSATAMAVIATDEVDCTIAHNVAYGGLLRVVAGRYEGIQTGSATILTEPLDSDQSVIAAQVFG